MSSAVGSENDVLDALERSRIPSYAAVSAAAVLLYDICLTIFQEISRSFLGTILLYRVGKDKSWTHTVRCRLLKPFLTVILLRSFRCEAFLWSSGFGQIITTQTVNIILVLRIHALYNRRRRILLLLMCLVIIELAIELYSTIGELSGAQVLDPPLGLPWSGCIFLPPDTRRYTLPAWVFCLFVAFVFFLMTMYKFIALTRGGYYLGGSTAWERAPPVLFTFVQDGSIYFLLTFCVVLVATLIMHINVLMPYTGVIIPSWVMTIYSLAGSRLILNLRAVTHGDMLDRSIEGSLVSSMRIQRHSGESTDVGGGETLASDVEMDHM
ncbi:unnamed protein product [Somion occarium]|uniref:Uncharacterized protein n=1 Tax=Somion occarium TaxID=3059160 RepID=A0ABP1E650_9APHY